MTADEPRQDEAPPRSPLRIWHMLLWVTAFCLLGGIVLFMAKTTCLCGHSALDGPMALAIFGSFTLGGLLVGRHLGAEEFAAPGRRVAAAVGLMCVGTLATLLLAGNDLDAAHRDAFKPADPQVIQQVNF